MFSIGSHTGRLACLLAASATMVCGAFAQEYPTRPITLVVPFAAGGAADTTGRIVAEAIGQRLGQNVLVENVPGAGGAIGSSRVKEADPDGYTIGLGHLGTLGASVAVNAELPFDPTADLDYLGLVSYTPSIIFVNNELPVQNLQEFIAYAQDPANPITFGHSGIGAASQLGCLLFFREIGVEQTDVPFQGFGQTILSVISGDIDGSCDLVVSAASYVREGTVRALAVGAPERSPALPDVPTAAEAGLPGFELEIWTGLFAPKGTPDEVVSRLETAVEDALADATVQERLINLGARIPTAEEQGGAHMQEVVDAEVQRWVELFAAAPEPTAAQ